MNDTLVTILIGLGSPVLVSIGALLSWYLKTRKEELQAIEERALERRIETYNKILHPLIVLFSTGADRKQKEEATKSITSIEYRQAAFNLITFGSDEMVNSYNEMMQSFYNGGANNAPVETMKKFANFLLSVRKDVNDKNTDLEAWDMLKFMIKDLDSYIQEKDN